MAENKLVQENSSYNVSSISIDVFSMLSLCCILISHLVANLFMHSLPGTYDSTLLGHTFFSRACFCLRYHHFCKINNNCYWEISGKVPSILQFNCLRTLIKRTSMHAGNYNLYKYKQHEKRQVFTAVQAKINLEH